MADKGPPNRARHTDFRRNEKGAIIANNQPNIRAALVRLGVTVSYDSFARRLLIAGPEGAVQRHLGDDEMARLYLRVDERFGFRPSREFFWMVVTNEARANSFHPVRDYLAGLVWDGKPRLDRWLVTYAGAKDCAYMHAVGSKCLIAAVRRARHPGCKFDEMVVFESPQGLEKSTALATLAVKDEWFTDSLPLNADDKQVIEALSGRWIIEAAELKGLRKGDVEHLKAFLSRQIDRARMSYDRIVTEAPRQCVIFGTTNSDAYLRDSTGNRRFWPVEVARFNVEALRQDRDQLWAESAHREAKGESIRLDPALYGAASEEQERRVIDDPWVPVIEKGLGAHATGKILASEAWDIVDVRPGMRTQDHNERLGAAMRKLGWERKKARFDGKVQWGYAKGTAQERTVRVCIRRGSDGTLDVFETRERDEYPRAYHA